MFLILYLVALIAVAAMAPGAMVYWDAFGYVLQAIHGDVGGLGLGRPVFVLSMHGIARVWLGSGGSPWHVEMVLRVACASAACLAAPLTAGLALDCGASRRAAWMAGLAVAVSPAMAHASGQVLTDGPGVFLLVAAYVLGTRATLTIGNPFGLALGSGVALGLAIGVREQAIVNVLTLGWFAWLAPRRTRWRLAGAMFAGCLAAIALPLVFVLATQPAYVDTIRSWLANMSRDRVARTYGWRDLAVYVGWLMSLGPAVVVSGALAIVSAGRHGLRRWPLLVGIVAPALLQAAWMATFRGIAYSPRFLIAALPAFAIPGALAIAAWAGDSRARWRVAIAAWLLPLIVAAPIVRARSDALTATLREWPSRLASLPVNAVIVTGQPCPAIPLVRALVTIDGADDGVRVRGIEPPAASPAWEGVCPGWAWPQDLAARLDRAISDGRVVVADLREASWTGPEQHAARDELERYVQSRAPAVSSGELIVWR